MISQLNIYPPKNWQDFEFLCLKLWGEIWKSQEDIEFNSDNSSGQDGVDIYSFVNNKKGYCGIQCKNKKLFKKNGEDNRITKATIDDEIERAKNFLPPLKKLVIATSATKDKLLEEYVRQINLLHFEEGLFSVQLCFWDYISRKIEEFESVYSWYLRNENFNKTKSIAILFESDDLQLLHRPNFIKTKVTYRLQTEEEKNEEIRQFSERLERAFDGERQSSLISLFQKGKLSINPDDTIYINGLDIKSDEYIKSTYPRPKKVGGKVHFNFGQYFQDKQALTFRIKLHNNGETVIENFKLKLSFRGNYEELYVKQPRLRDMNSYSATTWISDNSGLIEPDDNFIVQKDSFLSEEIILIPKKECSEIVSINWQLLSRDFNDSGTIYIKIEPEYIMSTSTMYVYSGSDCKEKYEYSCLEFKGNITINY